MPEKRHKARAESPRRGRWVEIPAEILLPGLFVNNKGNPRSDLYNGFNVAVGFFLDRKRVKVVSCGSRDPFSRWVENAAVAGAFEFPCNRVEIDGASQVGAFG